MCLCVKIEGANWENEGKINPEELVETSGFG